MTSNKLSGRRRTARKPPICNSGLVSPFPKASAAPTATAGKPMPGKLPGITPPIIPRSGRCPPPPPPPTPTITCSLKPDVVIIDEFQTGVLHGEACNSALPEDDPVNWTVASTGQPPAVQTDPTNCLETGDVEVEDDPGTYLLTATFFFSDGSQCVDTATLIVEEF